MTDDVRTHTLSHVHVIRRWAFRDSKCFTGQFLCVQVKYRRGSVLQSVVYLDALRCQMVMAVLAPAKT